MLLWILACKDDAPPDSPKEDTGCDTVWYADSDGDGFGDPEESTTACEAPGGWVADNSDCEDGDAEAFPGGAEVCDGVDNDCDGIGDAEDTDADQTTAQTWFSDEDGDGAGTGDGVLSCQPLEKSATTGGDCDDADPKRAPGLMEECGDGIDNDCDNAPGPCQWMGEFSNTGAQLNLAVTPTALAMQSGQLVVSSGAQVDLYNGLDTTSTASFSVLSDVLLGVGDIDGDTVPEFAAGTPTADNGSATAAGAVILLDAVPGGGTISFLEDEAGANAGTSLAVGEVSGDDQPDLLIGAPNWGAGDWGAVYVLEGPVSGAGGSLGGATRLYGAGTSDVGRLMAVADVDGDGVTDLVTATSNQVYTVLGPLTAGTISPDYQLAYIASALAWAGDVDGDGKEDILAGNVLAGGGDGEVKILKTNLKSHSTWTGPDGGKVGSDVASLGDVDGDGRADIVVAAPGVDQVYVMTAPEATGGVIDLAEAKIAADGCGLSTADHDGDGLRDLAVASCGDTAFAAVFLTRSL